MKMNKKIGVPGAYARKENYEFEGKNFEADIKTGDVVTILNAGTDVIGDYGPQTVFSIKTRNGEKNQPFNQGTINVLIEAFGDDSEKWVGKDVKVLLNKGMVAGQKRIMAYLVTEGWSLDEYGKLTKATSTGEATGTGVQTPAPDFDDVA